MTADALPLVDRRDAGRRLAEAIAALGLAAPVVLALPRGGVPVLTVTEARGRTFDHLFVLGLNAGSFPRPLGEDPLLPDAVRSALGMTPVSS